MNALLKFTILFYFFTSYYTIQYLYDKTFNEIFTDIEVTNVWTLENENLGCDNSVIGFAKSECGGESIIGGYKILGGPCFLKIKSFLSNTPSHWSIRIQLLIYKIDFWDKSNIKIYSEDLLNKKQTFFEASFLDDIDNLTNNICGDSNFNDEILFLDYNITNHISKDFYIVLELTTNQNNFLGFKNISLSIDECHFSCLECSGPKVFDCTLCFPSYYRYNGKCVMNCPDGTYADLISSICYSCDASCLKCDGPLSNNCIDCQKNVEYGFYLLEEGICVASCSSSHFPDKINFVCNQCYFSCLTCFGLGSNQCIDCRPSYFFHLNSCYSICPLSTFSNSLTMTCDLCHQSCLSCLGPNSNECLICNANYYESNGLCVTVCPSRTYSNVITKKCENCNSPCFECDGSDCISCENNYLIEENRCVQQCSNHFFFDSVKCDQCSVFCDTCTNKSSKGCLTCVANRYFNDSECILTCSKGYYPDHFNQMCMKCSISCLTCLGPLSTDCSTCPDGYLFYQRKCISICNAGTYYDILQNECVTCHSSCLTCNGPAISDCLTCDIYSTQIGNTCYRNCPIGKYYDNNLCLNCDNMCFSCYGHTSKMCTSCNSPYLLRNTECVAVCPLNYYLSVDLTTCLPCHSSCKECSGPLNTDCSDCNFPRILSNSECTDKCEPFYQISGKFSSICVYCEPACVIISLCVSPGDSLYNNNCYNPCPVGTYQYLADPLNVFSSVCKICDSTCKECSGSASNECLNCPNFYFFYQGQCFLICPDGTYNDANTNNCELCHIKCSTCWGSLETNCFSCPNSISVLYKNECVLNCPSINFFLDHTSSKCISCHSSCENCLENQQNSCLTCKTNFYYLNGECLSICPINTFADLNTKSCLNCDVACSECYGPNSFNCLTCSNGKFILSNVCYSNCPLGSFPSLQDQECIVCNKNCFSCFGPTLNDCLQCYNGFYLYTTTCVLFCPIGYYKLIIKASSTYICDVCHTNCISCVDRYDYCLTCKPEFLLQESSCVSICSDGYLLQGNYCFKCYEGCKMCTGILANECLTCFTNYFLFINACVTTCPDNFYNIIASNKCEACHPACRKCLDSTNRNCQVCNQGYYFLSYSCLNSCPPQTYLDSLTNKCGVCHPSCNTCSNKFSNSCLSCYNTFYLKMGSCVKTCPSDFYMFQNNCLPCHSNCKTCTGATENDCKTCNSNLLLYQKSCLIVCPNNSYLKNGNECKECTLPCASCSGGSSYECISCISDFYLETSTKKCLSKCSPGKFGNSLTGMCEPCEISCTTCNGPSNLDCEICASSKFLLENNCVDSCPIDYHTGFLTKKCIKCDNSGYFYNILSESCDFCHNSCTTCSTAGESNCLSCEKKGLWNGFCLENCPKGTFLNKTINICQNCEKYCLECEEDNCLKCFTDFYIYNQDCVQSCPIGMYGSFINEIKQCLKCSLQCNECIDLSTKCTKCNLNFYLSENNCLLNCPSNYYKDDIYKKCEKCHSNCKECTGSSKRNCISCYDGFYLNQNECVKNCSDLNKYGDSINKICILCDVTCKTCSGENLNECNECSSNFIIYKNITGSYCLDKCPINTFYDKFLNKCLECSENCFSCLNNSLKCDKCKDGFFNNNGSCFKVKILGFSYQPIEFPIFYQIICNIDCSNIIESIYEFVLINITNLNDDDYSYIIEKRNNSFLLFLDYKKEINVTNSINIYFNFEKDIILSNSYFLLTKKLNIPLSFYKLCSSDEFHYINELNECIKKPIIFLSIDYTSNPRIFSIKFLNYFENLNNLVLNNSYITIIDVNSNDYYFDINKKDDKTYYLEIINSKKILNFPLLTYTLNITNEIIYRYHLKIIKYNDSIQVYDLKVFDASNSLNLSLTSIVGSQSISLTTLAIINSYMGSTLVGIKGLMLIEIIFILKYINLNYPEFLRDMFNEKSKVTKFLYPYEIEINLVDSQMLPKEWIKYKIYNNFNNNLAELIFRLLLSWLIGLLSQKIQKNNKCNKLINFLQVIFVWTLTLLLYVTYLQELFFKVYVLIFYYKKPIGYISDLDFFISFSCLIINFIIIFHLKNVITVLSIMKNENYESNINKIKNDTEDKMKNIVIKLNNKSIETNIKSIDDKIIELKQILENEGEIATFSPSSPVEKNINENPELINLKKSTDMADFGEISNESGQNLGMSNKRFKSKISIFKSEKPNSLKKIDTLRIKRKEDFSKETPLFSASKIANLNQKDTKKSNIFAFLKCWSWIKLQFNALYRIDNNNYKKYLAKYELLVKNCRYDSNYLQYFFLFDMLRQILMALIVSSCYNHPIFETSALLVIQISYLIFFLITKPLFPKSALFITVLMEVFTNFAIISAFIISIYDNLGGDFMDEKSFFGWIIVYSNLILLLLLIFYIILDFLMLNCSKVLKNRFIIFSKWRKKIKLNKISPNT